MIINTTREKYLLFQHIYTRQEKGFQEYHVLGIYSFQ